MKIGSLDNWSAEEELIASYIKQKSFGKQLHVLEAGCGQKWDQADLLNEVSYKLVGVDLDQKALEYRKNVLGDLDEIIHGDLRFVDFEANYFHVIFSSFVLEHVRGAEDVLKKFTKWLKPGGLLILRIPDPESVYGFASRILPFQIHVLFLKYVIGQKDAGTEGTGPYPTVYERVVSRPGIQDFCKSHSLLIKEELCDAYIHKYHEHPYPVLSKLSRAGSFLSFGRLVGNHRNLLYILEKI